MQMRHKSKVTDISLTSDAKVISKYLAAGKILEVKEGDSYFVAVVAGSHEPIPGHQADVKYEVVDASGATRFVRASQVVVVLPGANYETSAAREFDNAVRDLSKPVVLLYTVVLMLGHPENYSFSLCKKHILCIKVSNK